MSNMFILHVKKCLKLTCTLAVVGGSLTREQLRALPGAQQGLVKKYIDKNGKKRHVGVAGRLKQSQLFSCNTSDN